ncbi:MAG TPA: GFA family protein [Arenicellales bacterium]|nr:GFA family protein [Arenicellales bacterium]
MMLRRPASGRCQCGGCSYTLDSEPYVAYTCHCIESQKLTASAFLSCMQVASESLKITSGSPTTRERIADSGNVLGTWFCSSCGSTLFAENSARPRIRTVHIGSLEYPEDVEVAAHIWVKRKLPWIHLPKNHRIFDEAGDWTEDYAQDLSRYKPPNKIV